MLISEMNGHGHDFGHELVSESMSEADSDTDTAFLRTSDTDSDTDSGKVMTSDADTSSDKGMSEILGHGFGHGHEIFLNFGRGHGQTSDIRVHSSLPYAMFLMIFGFPVLLVFELKSNKKFYYWIGTIQPTIVVFFEV